MPPGFLPPLDRVIADIGSDEPLELYKLPWPLPSRLPPLPFVDNDFSDVAGRQHALARLCALRLWPQSSAKQRRLELAVTDRMLGLIRQKRRASGDPGGTLLAEFQAIEDRFLIGSFSDEGGIADDAEIAGAVDGSEAAVDMALFALRLYHGEQPPSYPLTIERLIQWRQRADFARTERLLGQVAQQRGGTPPRRSAVYDPIPQIWPEGLALIKEAAKHVVAIGDLLKQRGLNFKAGSKLITVHDRKTYRGIWKKYLPVLHLLVAWRLWDEIWSPGAEALAARPIIEHVYLQDLRDRGVKAIVTMAPVVGQLLVATGAVSPEELRAGVLAVTGGIVPPFYPVTDDERARWDAYNSQAFDQRR